MNIFIENKYKTLYFKIIEQYKAYELDDKEYVEIHHIIPHSFYLKSGTKNAILEGDPDSINNLIALPPRVHFICHLLLTKMVYNGPLKYKVDKALSMLMNVKNIGAGRYIPNSRWYEYSRNQMKNSILDFWTEERKLEHSLKISEYWKKLLADPILSAQTSRRRSEAGKHKIWTNKAIENRMNNCLKAAANRIGKPWNENRRKAYENNQYTQTKESNDKRSAKLIGRRTSIGTTKTAIFLNPNNEIISISPLNKIRKECNITNLMFRRLLDKTISDYKGWRLIEVIKGDK